MISLNLTRVPRDGPFDSRLTYIVQNKIFFTDWEGNLCSTGNRGNDRGYEFIGNSYGSVAGGGSNRFQSTFVGSYKLNNYTISLPILQNEEDFINNKIFNYAGKNYGETLTYSRYTGNNAFPAGLYMVLGSGDTPPTPDDYKLESWIPTSELSVQNYNGTAPAYQSPPPFILSITTLYKNVTNNNITVKEVGLARSKMQFADDGANDRMAPPLLMVRDVLQNPVIVKPEEITSFTVMIK
jgi:hypothetical protein